MMGISTRRASLRAPFLASTAPARQPDGAGNGKIIEATSHFAIQFAFGCRLTDASPPNAGSIEGNAAMKTIRLTTAQALTRYLAQQMTEVEGKKVPLFAGVWAIFGHGNVAAIGEALYQVRDELPTYRAHNEQAMAHAAIAFAKASFRRRMMAVTSSIGPGATNMVTAAAVAHVNRLPLLLLPGDVFANRRPDPVLQQIEDFGDGTVSANDCFRPVSRYFDRITRPDAEGLGRRFCVCRHHGQDVAMR
jgi:Thiamine pyrophosphate enzyme, N-terminal TPP binding domain